MWTHCGRQLKDDQLTCELCGASKRNWTVRLAQTRIFTIAKRGWIEIGLLGDDDRPLDEPARFLLELPRGGVVSGELRGLIRITGLDRGDARLTFPGLDRTSWEPLTAPPAAQTSQVLEVPVKTLAPIQGGLEPAPGVVETRIVETGDCVASLAHRHGLLPACVWEAPENAALRERRQDLYLLAPGDEVRIPARQARLETCPSGQRIWYRRRGVPERLLLELRDEGRPRSDLPYELEVEGELCARGTTDGAGRLEAWIPPEAREARLLLPDEVIHLALGALGPRGEDDGLCDRLENLGYLDSGAREGDALVRGLTAFQQAEGLRPSGELDDPTRCRLVELYGA
jgi:hypothetical protein